MNTNFPHTRLVCRVDVGTDFDWFYPHLDLDADIALGAERHVLRAGGSHSESSRPVSV